jgi:predicted DCC family thiol-disulfide oxidoreductase YuxK
MTDPGALLLYDGSCGFCARSVQFVLGHEGARRTLRFAPLQGTRGTELLRRHPGLQRIDSLIWYEPASAGRSERLLVRSSAVIAVAAYLGSVWRLLAVVARIIPRPVRDAAYDWVARHRHQLAAESCLVPTPEQRVRFVD